MILFFVLFISFAFSAEIVEFEANRKTLMNIKYGDTRHLLFRGDFKEQKDLQVELSEQNKQKPVGNVIIYMSQSESSPSESNYEQICDFTESHSACYYHFNQTLFQKEDKEKQRVYIGITCSDKLNCEFQLQLIHDLLYILDEYVKQPHQIHMSEAQDSYHLSVPLPEKSEYEYYVIVVEIKQVNHQINKEGFKNNIWLPQELQAEVSLYEEQLIAIIYSNKEKVCERCFIPMVVELPRGAYFEVSILRITKTTTSLTLNSLLTDKVDKKRLKHYELKDVDCQNDLRLSLTNLHGSHKQLYVNPEMAALSRWMFQWVSPYSSNAVQEDLVITAKELQQVKHSLQANRTTLTLHIAVYSYNQGFFQLRVQEHLANNHQQIPIKIGHTQSGKVLTNQFVNYELQAYDHPQEAFRRNLTISLSVLSGKIEMYMMRCKAQDCKELDDQSINDKGVSFINSHSSQLGFQRYNLQPECKSIGNSMCYYIIALKGVSKVSGSSKYILRVYYQNSFLSVQQDQPQKVHVSKGEPARLKYKLTSELQESAKKVRFMVSDSHMTMKVKWGHSCYQWNVEHEGDQCQESIGDSLSPVELQTGFNYTYYIILSSHVTTDSLFETQLYYNSTQSEDNDQHEIDLVNKKVRHLIRGVPSKAFLNAKLNEYYFQFETDYNEDVTNYISLDQISQRLEMSVRSDGRLPTQHNYHWISSSNYLEISPMTNPSHYKRKATYVIRIRTQPNATPLHYQNIYFLVNFYTDKTVQQVPFNRVQYVKLPKEYMMEYYFYADPDEINDIDINTHVFQSTQQQKPSHLLIYASEQPFPTYSDLLPHQSLNDQTDNVQNDFQWKNTLLSQKRIKQICQMQKSQIQEQQQRQQNKCKVFIVLKNQDVQNELEVSFRVKNQELEHHLQEGKAYHFNSKAFFQQENVKPIQAYLVPESADSFLDLQVMSSVHKYSMKVELTDSSNHKILQSQNSKSQSRHMMVFNKELLAICKPNCLLHIELFMSPLDQMEFKKDKIDFDMTMIVLGQLTQMSAQTDYSFSLSPKEVKYFQYDLSQQQKQGVQFSIETYQGHPIVYHKIFGDHHIEFPTRFDNDFVQYSPSLQITSDQMKEAIKRLPYSFKKLFMITAVSYYNYYSPSTPGMFNVNVKNKFNTLYNLYYNNLVSFQSFPNQVMVFKIYHYNTQEQNVRISLDTQIDGSYDIQQKECVGYDTIEQCVGQMFHENKVKRVNTQMIQYKMNVGCKGCYSVIGIKSDCDLKGDIVIRMGDSALRLKSQQTYRESLSSEKTSTYSMMILNNQPINLNVNLLGGKIKVHIQDSQLFSNANNGTTHVLYGANSLLDLLISPPTSTITNRYSFFIQYKYVHVQAYLDSQFTISYSYPLGNQQILLEGVGLSASIGNETKSYRMDVSNQKGNKKSVVTILMKQRDQLLSIDDINVTFFQMNQHLINSKNHKQIINQLKVLSQGERFITYEVSQQNIESENKKRGEQNKIDSLFMELKVEGLPIETNIIWHGQENAFMIPYNSHYTLVDTKRQHNRVQFYFEQDGWLDLQIVNCQGNTFNRLSHNTSHSITEDDKAKCYKIATLMKGFNNNECLVKLKEYERTDRLINERQRNNIEVFKGTYDLHVNSLSENTTTQIVSSFLAKADRTTHEQIRMNDAVADYQVNKIEGEEMAEVIVLVDRLDCINCNSIASKAQVDYKVIISDSKQALAQVGLCQLCTAKQQLLETTQIVYEEQKMNNVSISSKGDALVFKFVLKYKEIPYFIQPIALVHNMNDKGEKKEMIMEVQEIQVLEWHQVKKNRFIGVMIMGTLLLASLALCLIIRNNQFLRMKLKYEMTDFRNIANIKGEDSLELSQRVQLKGLDSYKVEQL